MYLTQNVFDTFWNFVLTSFRYANTVHRSADANTETSDFVIDCVRANSMVSGLNWQPRFNGDGKKLRRICKLSVDRSVLYCITHTWKLIVYNLYGWSRILWSLGAEKGGKVLPMQNKLQPSLELNLPANSSRETSV